MSASQTEVERWFKSKNWKPFDFQRQAWQAILEGHSGLVHAPTGMGKSYSVWMGVVQSWLSQHAAHAHPYAAARKRARRASDSTTATAVLEQPAVDRKNAEPLLVLWITPMRALANDIWHSLMAPVAAFQLPWTVEARTGDTSSSDRRKQRDRLPTVLITTPESLSLMLSYADARERLAKLRYVIVDEWHELLGGKRGVQAELGVARLRHWNPDLQTWGLSATLGNLEQALEVLLGSGGNVKRGVLVEGHYPKKIGIETILPEDMERFPWSGHLGVRLLPQVIEALSRARSTLLFTNTRSQAEIWFRALLAARPDWAAELALHHGSLDREMRAYVEQRLREGTMRCVVCTSSLDLGVDFAPVDQVLQVGSPKGVARLLQRAGRSGHQPGAASRVLCVPTNAFELVEFAAAREAALRRDIEERNPIEAPLDVLVQHLVTIAASGGFSADELLAEVRTAYAYRNLSPAQWQWALDFVTRGGPALRAYPQYARLIDINGRYLPASQQVVRLHRMTIGTITSEAAISVRYVSGGSLGTVEESFIARMRAGDRFVFAGHTLELVRWRDLTAYVRKAKGTSGIVPRWNGGRFPLSTQLALAVRRKFAEARDEIYEDPEMKRVRPLLELQQAWSHLPSPGEMLIERCKVREGYQTFVYPFEGRSVNEGLASLLAFRISRRQACSITITPNDYGFELLSNEPLDYGEEDWRKFFSSELLLEDLLGCLNAAELARRQFRDIARVSGLIFSGYPGAPRSNRQLQASSGLLYDVFREHDPENLLLDQARREVYHQQLESSRMQAALVRIASLRLLVVSTPRLTPLSFPLWAARIQTTHLSSQKWSARVEKMVLLLEHAADRMR